MVKKVSITLISLVILIAGSVAFSNLHFWERSVEIFKMKSDSTEGRNYEGRRGNFDRRNSLTRTEGERDRRERSDFRNMPDSVRQRIIAERNLQSFPDSLMQGRSRTFSGYRDASESRGFDRSGHRGGDFRRGRNVNLGAVGWFLAVFALFTVITIYIDMVLNILRKRKKRKLQSAD